MDDVFTMLTAAKVLAPEIEICGIGESLTGSLNVAVIVTISPDLYGPGVEYVMAAVGGVLSSTDIVIHFLSESMLILGEAQAACTS